MTEDNAWYEMINKEERCRRIYSYKSVIQERDRKKEEGSQTVFDELDRHMRGMSIYQQKATFSQMHSLRLKNLLHPCQPMTIVSSLIATDGIGCFRPCLRPDLSNSDLEKNDHRLEYTISRRHELDSDTSFSTARVHRKCTSIWFSNNDLSIQQNISQSALSLSNLIKSKILIFDTQSYSTLSADWFGYSKTLSSISTILILIPNHIQRFLLTDSKNHLSNTFSHSHHVTFFIHIILIARRNAVLITDSSV